MSGKKILVTGGTGFIGQGLVNKLVANNYNVAVTVSNIKAAKQLFDSTVCYIDYKNTKLFKSSIEEFSPDIVIHLAAYSTSRDDLEAIEQLIESNILFTSRLLDALRLCNIELFVNTGSFSEYSESNGELSPAYFYSATKTSARYIVDYFSKIYGYKTIDCTLYTVYGKTSANKKVIDYIIDSLGIKSAINMTAGEQILDFIHVDDVINFYLLLISKHDEIQSMQAEYSVGTGRGCSIKELSILIEKISGYNANINWGAIGYRPLDIMNSVANIQKAKAELNWQASIPLEEGIKQYLAEVSIKSK
jgi:nucleoside-diphosphate-sugar epimerase